ncbi:MAG TPA: hypothetical protein VGG31_05440 [Candidatus Dormibacteraeota bacterium]
MDPRTLERLQLDQHRAVTEVAELRARLLPEAANSPVGRWMAAGLRGLADRLDGRGAVDARPANLAGQ